MMSGSRRGMRYAIAGFLLMSLVVLGAMSGVSLMTYQVALRDIRDKHEGKALRMLGALESHVTGILGAETARTYTDYLAVHACETIFDREGERFEPGKCLMASPILMAGTPYRWIDLYFHVDQDGEWSSPQNADPDVIRTLTSTFPDTVPDSTASFTLARLQEVLSQNTLQARIDQAVERERQLYEAMSTEDTDATLADWRDAELHQRRLSARGSVSSYLPMAQCLTPRTAEGNIRNLVTNHGLMDDPMSQPPSVEIRLEDFVSPFWLPVPEGKERKLVFVRRAYKDADMFLQGFVADWSTLKVALLDRIGNPETVDLIPVPEATTPERMLMTNLPVRLSKPYPVKAQVAAWQSVRAPLLLIWAATMAVLAAAGWGIRNLLALTERHMQFAYAVTHELRTPLTTFRLYSDMLAANLVPEESKQEYLTTLERESRRLSSLVEGVLEYARLEKQRVRLNLVETTGPALLDILSETLNRRCQDFGIEASASNGLSADQIVQTDVNVINQIAGVLVDNACRHARNRTDAKVELILALDDGKVHLDIIDSGPGIDRADARHLFKPFRRGKRADEAAHGGIGLGLALARDWARLLGGRLDLIARHDPRLGGAHFRLISPARITEAGVRATGRDSAGAL